MFINSMNLKKELLINPANHNMGDTCFITNDFFVVVNDFKKRKLKF